ncbi:MAG TPA: hypothetical protein PKN95_10765 [Verrucomicrobiota bacterium]|nr:hypothetical protein [Verrucomicrobiota bacterium]HNT15673.1 hypothetical protein [Verrucomicrobiota bacterium]
MQKLLVIASFLALATASRAAWFTNNVSIDSFVRAASPASNYGGAGALSVSGASAVNGAGVTNGAFDSFIRFNTAGAVSNFNSLFGTNNWVLNGARLRVTETAAPNNALFNRGTGAFEIRWIANDNWIEGTGNPNNPAATGITYNDEPALLNIATDAPLGTFTNAGANGALAFSLALPPEFVTDVMAAGEVGLFLTAIDPGLGFTFNSRSFGTVSARPFLEISAVPRPGISTISLSGNDVVLTATNGVAGGTYRVLSSTNLALPLDQWLPVATHLSSTNGGFTITLANAAGTGLPTARFFVLETQ